MGGNELSDLIRKESDEKMAHKKENILFINYE